MVELMQISGGGIEQIQDLVPKLRRVAVKYQGSADRKTTVTKAT